MLQSQQIKDLRKSGKLDEALQLAQKDLEANPANLFAKRNIGWVFNDILKTYTEQANVTMFIEILKKIQKLEMPETETMLFDNVAWKIGSLFYKVSKFQTMPYSQIFEIIDILEEFHYTKPSESYSFLLKAVHKVLKVNRDKYISFIKWWNFENLRREDYQKENLPDGKQIMSLAEQVYTAYFKAMVPSPVNPVAKETVLECVNEIDKIFEVNDSYIYLIYFKIQMLLAIGERENLLKDFLPFARRKSKEFWVWDLLSQIVSDEDDKLTCLSMACLSGIRVEQMKTNIYYKMAEYFISKEMYPQAKSEILKIQKIKTENSQKIPDKVLSKFNETWFVNSEVSSSNVDFYKDNSGRADQILYADIPSEDIFVYYVNSEKKILNFIKTNDEIGFFKYDKLNPSFKVCVSNILQVRFANFSAEGPSKVYSMKIVENEDLKQKNTKIVKGVFKINEKGFGFIENIYVSQKTIENLDLHNNETITVLVMRKFSRKKEGFDWEVIRKKRTRIKIDYDII